MGTVEAALARRGVNVDVRRGHGTEVNGPRRSRTFRLLVLVVCLVTIPGTTGSEAACSKELSWLVSSDSLLCRSLVYIEERGPNLGTVHQHGERGRRRRGS